MNLMYPGDGLGDFTGHLARSVHTPFVLLVGALLQNGQENDNHGVDAERHDRQ